MTEVSPPGQRKLRLARLRSDDIIMFVMAALRSRCGHYIFALWFLLSSSFFFFLSLPNLSRRRLDVYRTSIRGVALVRI